MTSIEYFVDLHHHSTALSITLKMAPGAVLSHLHRADGSATYTHNGYSIIGAVNGPVEVLRRDEMPEEATVEVNIRPAFGVGGTLSISFVRKASGC